MGEWIVKKWKSLERQYKVAFFSAFAIGLLTHMFMMTNKLPNHDYIYAVHSDMFRWPLSLGRWFLHITTGISSYFVLPWLNGLLAIFYASCSVALIVSVLEVKKTVPVVLCAALFVTYPAFADTMGYMCLVDGFMLALCQVILGVWFWYRKRGMVGVIGLAVCLSLGIASYQSYLSFAIMLILIRLILDIIEKKYENREFLLCGVKALAGGILGVGLYYAALMIVMKINKVTFASYMGANSMSLPGIGKILRTLAADTAAFGEMFIGGNSDFTTYEILNAIFVAAFLILMAVVFIKRKLYLKKLQTALLIVAGLLFIPAVYIFDFLSDEVIYRFMMLYSLVLIYMLFVKLADEYLSGWRRETCAALIAVIAFNFAIITNIAYLNLNHCWEETYATAIRMQERITMLDGFSKDRQIMVTGTMETQGRTWLLDRIPYMVGTDDVNLLRNQDFIRVILDKELGMWLDGVNDAERERVLASSGYTEMKCWPASDSVKMIEGVIVIKLSEEKEEP